LTSDEGAAGRNVVSLHASDTKIVLNRVL